MRVAVLNTPHTPLDAIPKEEEYDKHFFLLLGMDALVVSGSSPEPVSRRLPYEDERPEAYCHESLKRNDVVKYHFHSFLYPFCSVIDYKHTCSVKSNLIDSIAAAIFYVTPSRICLFYSNNLADYTT